MPVPTPTSRMRAADALGRGDRGLAAALEHRAEHEVVDRRPARVGLLDRASLSSSLAIASSPRRAARSMRCGELGASRALRRLQRRAAMKPPPSTRAWPSALS